MVILEVCLRTFGDYTMKVSNVLPTYAFISLFIPFPQLLNVLKKIWYAHAYCNIYIVKDSTVLNEGNVKDLIKITNGYARTKLPFVFYSEKQ